MSIIPPMRLVIVESPYRATEHRTQEQHREYLRLALADCIRRGESPMASHHLLPEILMDDTPYERALGIRAGLAWGVHADVIAVYSQLGVSPGMAQAIGVYKDAGKPIKWRGVDPRQVRRILEMEPHAEEV
jgi:hypothetical protein